MTEKMFQSKNECRRWLLECIKEVRQTHDSEKPVIIDLSNGQWVLMTLTHMVSYKSLQGERYTANRLKRALHPLLKERLGVHKDMHLTFKFLMLLAGTFRQGNLCYRVTMETHPTSKRHYFTMTSRQRSLSSPTRYTEISMQVELHNRDSLTGKGLHR